MDTDVFSFVWRRDTRAEPYRAHLEGRIASISFQTVAELLYGARRRSFGSRRMEELRQEMRKYFVVPFNLGMAEEWAKVRASRSIDAADAWIAATALWVGCPVLTHNRRHFTDIPGLTMISHST